jgi:hypothetical protein
VIDADLATFFDVDEFAREFTRARAAAADLVFPGILGVVDEHVFDSHATVTMRRLRFAAAHDVQAGDTITDGVSSWLVERVELRVEGSEAEAVLVISA